MARDPNVSTRDEIMKAVEEYKNSPTEEARDTVFDLVTNLDCAYGNTKLLYDYVTTRHSRSPMTCGCYGSLETGPWSICPIHGKL